MEILALQSYRLTQAYVVDYALGMEIFYLRNLAISILKSFLF